MGYLLLYLQVVRGQNSREVLPHPSRLANRRYLAGGVRAARYEKPRDEGDERVIPERVAYLTRARRWRYLSLKKLGVPQK